MSEGQLSGSKGMLSVLNSIDANAHTVGHLLQKKMKTAGRQMGIDHFKVLAVQLNIAGVF